MLPLLILVPLGLLVLLNLPLGLRKLAVPMTVLLGLLQAAMVVFYPDWLSGQGNQLSNYLKVLFDSDKISLVLLASTGLVMAVTSLVSAGMMSDERKRFNFASVLLIAMVGMNGIVILTDLFSMYVFMEIISIASFILIAFNRDRRGLEGAFKYLVLSAVASVLMLSSVAILMMMSDSFRQGSFFASTSFTSVHLMLQQGPAVTITRIAMAAFICGLFIKSGMVPFHGWLPAAYSAAPGAASVFLAGIATKAGGVYALIRLVNDVLPRNAAIGHVLMLVGVVSIVVGALAALGQKDMKRLLAYSSISQIGYIVLALGCYAMPNVAGAVTTLALMAALFHLFNHAIFKTLLFVNAAALEQRLGTTELAKMGGLSVRMPVTNVTNVLGLLSTAGIPPLSGFWSKLLIIVALWKAGVAAGPISSGNVFIVYAFIAIGCSVLTLAYLLIVQRRVFFGKLPAELSEVTEASNGLVFSSVLLAAITVGLGVLAPYVLNLFQLPQ